MDVVQVDRGRRETDDSGHEATPDAPSGADPDDILASNAHAVPVVRPPRLGPIPLKSS